VGYLELLLADPEVEKGRTAGAMCPLFALAVAEQGGIATAGGRGQTSAKR
jgi:hypothetical protein